MGILQTIPPRLDGWAGTRWSVVCNLEARETSDGKASWEYLVDHYRTSMEHYVRRVISRRVGPSAATVEPEDVVQDFFGLCVEKNWLAKADPSMGRFRAYLQVLLRRHTNGVLDRILAQKRTPGEGRKLVPLGELDPECTPTAEEDAEVDEFFRHWTRVAVDRALARLRAEHERIEYLDGSSVSDEVVARARAAAADAERVLVILDSDHGKPHVLKELGLYSALVTSGSYIIVEDTNLNGHPVHPGHGPGPMEAVEEFLAGDPGFERDPSREKFMLTFNPKGYLRKR